MPDDGKMPGLVVGEDPFSHVLDQLSKLVYVNVVLSFRHA
jgi:hypothetical protein